MSPPGPAASSRWRLDGYRVLITGSTKGIGFACAREFLDLGAEVLLNGRNNEDLYQAMKALGGPGPRVFGIQADISTPEGRDRLVSAVREYTWSATPSARREDHLPVLDCLVNNAGTNVRASVLEASDADYARIMALNLDATYHLTRRLHPLLANSPRPTIVNVASAAGVASTGSGAAYAMSKAAVIQLTKTLACEWAPRVRVNCVAPWVTRTPLLEAAVDGDPRSARALEEAERATPLGRAAEPEDMAGAVVFLTLPASAYVTGQCLGVDGGLSAEHFAGPCVERKSSRDAEV